MKFGIFLQKKVPQISVGKIITRKKKIGWCHMGEENKHFSKKDARKGRKVFKDNDEKKCEYKFAKC